jgi:hypothetical protein
LLKIFEESFVMFRKFGLILATVFTFAACGGGGSLGGPSAGGSTPGGSGQNTAGGPPTTPVTITIADSSAKNPKSVFDSIKSIFSTANGYSLTISQNYILGSGGECSVPTASCLPPITYY